jgi:hypothetical protein
VAHHGGTREITMEEALQQRTATSAPDHEASYWDNTYHYGYREEGANDGTVTFFPILQPAVILFLTAISICLTIFVIYLVLKQPPNSRSRLAPRDDKAPDNGSPDKPGSRLPDRSADTAPGC